ncbi:MAG: hypothetical protein V4629_11390 [Pseudomonadota bacterium]
MKKLPKWSTFWVIMCLLGVASKSYATQCFVESGHVNDSVTLASVNGSIEFDTGVQILKSALDGPATVLTRAGRFTGSGTNGVNYNHATQTSNGTPPSVWVNPFINPIYSNNDVNINPNVASAAAVVTGNLHPHVSNFIKISGNSATGYIIQIGPNQRAESSNFQYIGDLVLEDISNPAQYGKHTFVFVGGEYYVENIKIGNGWKVIQFSYEDGTGRAGSPSLIEGVVVDKFIIGDDVKFSFEDVDGYKNVLGPDDVAWMVGLESACSDAYTMTLPEQYRNCNNPTAKYSGGQVIIGDNAQFFGSMYIYDNGQPNKGTLDIGSNSVLTGSYLVDGDVTVGKNSTLSFSYLTCNIELNEALPPVPDSITAPLVTSSCHDGFYSLASPIVGSKTSVGDLLIAPAQRDFDELTKPGTSGHLRAFKIKENGKTNDAPEWDAANLMTLAHRSKLIYTQSENAGNKFEILQLISDEKLTSSDYFDTSLTAAKNYRETIINPNYDEGSNLFGRNPSSLVGQPWRTAPILVDNKAVIFAADDGLLYGINPSNGALKWAWFPRELLKQSTTPNELMRSHPWGQLTAIQHNNNSYVLGTAMHGQLRFSIQLDKNGDLTKAPAWIDFDEKITVPNGDSKSPIHAGGASPTVSLLSSSRVAYIQSKNGADKLIIRNTHNDANTLTKNLVKPSSNLIYISDKEYYYGDESGKIRNATNAVVGDLGQSDRILSLTGTYLVGQYGGLELYLLANTSSRIVAFAKNFSGEWNQLWFTDTNSSSSPDVPKMRPINGTISASPSIVGGAVLVPVTDYVDVSYDCDNSAYVFGPLDLKTGHPQKNILSLNNSLNWSNEYTVKIGGVEALGLGLSTVGNKKFAIEFSGTDDKPLSSKHGELAIEIPVKSPNLQKGWRELTTYRK